MLPVRVILLPSLLRPEDVLNRVVVVFDVLRATTSITAAMEHGAKEICVFGSIDDARTAAMTFAQPKLLAGEQKCLPPDGFDCGNSPTDFTAERVSDKTIFFATTNGTRALMAAAGAKRLFAASLRNADAVAKALAELALPITLLCAGTEGGFSIEDTIGCGAVLTSCRRYAEVHAENDAALLAEAVFRHSSNDLAHVLSLGKAAGNLRGAKLESDIAFCAVLNASTSVAECDPQTMTLRRLQAPIIT